MHVNADPEENISGVFVAGNPSYRITKAAPKTKANFTAFAVDSQRFASEGLSLDYLRMQREIAQLKAEVVALKEKVATMQAAEEYLEIREIPRAQAKKEIKAYFEAHHGQNVYPSDLMEAIGLDYDLVWELCNELEKEAKIKGL